MRTLHQPDTQLALDRVHTPGVSWFGISLTCGPSREAACLVAIGLSFARSVPLSTITSAPPTPSLAPLASPDVYRMTVDEYERLAEADVLDDDRVELIDGYLVRKMPKKPPHTFSVDAILEVLKATLPGWWC